MTEDNVDNVLSDHDEEVFEDHQAKLDDREENCQHDQFLQIQDQITEILHNVGVDRIASINIGQSPLRRSKSVTIFETNDGDWKCEEKYEDEGLIL